MMLTYDELRALMMAEDDSRCCFRLFGPPSQPKILKIRPRGYFFMLSSILMLPGFKIPPKSQKITKNWIFKKSDFQKSMKNGSEPIRIYSFSRRIRFRIPNWTKTVPKPDFDQFSKIFLFL